MMNWLWKMLNSRTLDQAPHHESDRPRPIPRWCEPRLALSVLLVGPGQPYQVPSQAAANAHDGDTVKIAAGTYKGDVAIWRANNLTIMGVNGRAVIDETGFAIANRKGIWVISGNNTTVKNIEFTGARDASGRDKNWAGIRQEGATLNVSNCSFHDNDNGLLTGANPNSDITIKQSEFASNGAGDGYSHNMYIGQVRSFTLAYCSSHDARIGHLVKSRAATNKILYNSLMDGPDGTASLEVDLPNGGRSYLIGNVIVQGPRTANSAIISYAEEGASNLHQELYVVNNTIVNNRGSGTFVAIAGQPTDARLINNIFAGGGAVLSGPATAAANLVSNDPGFVDPVEGDYQLAPGSPAINAGTNPGTGDKVSLTPRYEYQRLNGAPRARNGALDIGAYEL